MTSLGQIRHFSHQRDLMCRLSTCFEVPCSVFVGVRVGLTQVGHARLTSEGPHAEWMLFVFSRWRCSGPDVCALLLRPLLCGRRGIGLGVTAPRLVNDGCAGPSFSQYRLGDLSRCRGCEVAFGGGGGDVRKEIVERTGRWRGECNLRRLRRRIYQARGTLGGLLIMPAGVYTTSSFGGFGDTSVYRLAAWTRPRSGLG